MTGVRRGVARLFCIHWLTSGRVLFVSLLLLSTSMPAAMPETIVLIKPSIVAVGTFQKTRSSAFLFRGTGFVVGDGTIVATNAHVLPEQVSAQHREVLVIMSGEGRQRQVHHVEIVAIDARHDLALLRSACCLFAQSASDVVQQATRPVLYTV